MISQKHGKIKLNIEKPGKVEDKLPDVVVSSKKEKSVVDAFMNKHQAKGAKYSILNESNTEINAIATKVFNQMGLVVNDSNHDPLAHNNILKRVNLYLTRFPEVEYLIDMISSSVIYSSSSNTKKIQFILNGEHYLPKKELDSTQVDDTSHNIQPEVGISDIKMFNNFEKVDSQYEDLNIEVGNMFKRNNIKLSLYGLMTSMTKYGCGIFYVKDPSKQDDVSFYSLDEVKFIVKDRDVLPSNVILSELEERDSKLFKSAGDNEEIKQFNSKEVEVRVIEDDTNLKHSNIYFISEKGIFGRSIVIKIIHYLKIIELLELSLLIERLSKTRTTHVWKLDLSKVEEDDIAPTMMLYRNLLKNQMSLNYDENDGGMQLDIVKNLVDNNILVPTEEKNLDITTLRSEFKPLMDDVNYYQDKIYLSLGIPIHYRGTDNKSYVNNNMLIMHDNVYSMKIRHYQLIINNLLTFQIENWLRVSQKALKVKYVNINIPEFIPISERKETDLDKSSKFVTMFTQLEQMMGIKIKQDFILNKLFPNDIMSDIVDVKDQEEIEEENAELEEEESNEDIMSLFESAGLIKKERRGINLFSVRERGKFNVLKYKLKLNIDW